MTSLVSIFDVPQTNAREILYSGLISASCTANESSTPKASGETDISPPGDPAAPNGAAFATLRTSDGDPNVEGDETYYDIPLFPAPFTVVDGQLQNVGGETEPEPAGRRGHLVREWQGRDRDPVRLSEWASHER